MTEIKTWQERYSDDENLALFQTDAMEAEIAELRAALAQPAREPMTAGRCDVPPFVTVRDMNYPGEVMHGRWDGTHYMLDDGDCYKPERLAKEYDAIFSDTAPQAPAEPISDAEISHIWKDVVESGDPLANNNFHIRFARALLEKAR